MSGIVSVREIEKNLPLLFEILNHGGVTGIYDDGMYCVEQEVCKALKHLENRGRLRLRVTVTA